MKHSLGLSITSAFLLCCILLVTSCKKDTVDHPTSNNKSPVANAGADQIITLPNNVVTLDGSGSTDPDNNITGYIWSKISGPPTFNIVNAYTVQTQVTNLVEGVYQFELRVTDNGGLSTKDTIKVIVNAPNNLSGKEFIFDNLIWVYYYWDVEMNISTPARPDLFVNAPGSNYNPSLKAEVYWKLDTANTWIKVRSGSSLPDPTLPYDYSYGVYSSKLYISVWPINLPLEGKKASIKVKFL